MRYSLLTILVLSILLTQIFWGCSRSDDGAKCDLIENIDNPECNPATDIPPVKV